MAPGRPAAKAESTKASRKRKIDEPRPVAKRQRRSKKVEEKENVSKSASPSSSSTPPLSTAGSSRESPNVIINYASTSRRKHTPVKLDQLKTTIQTSRNSEEIKRYYEKHNEADNRKFLVKNVIQKRKLMSNGATCRLRNKPSIDAVISSLQDKYNKRNDLHELCQLNYTMLKSWGNSMDTTNYTTSAAAIQGYVVIVSEKNNVSIIENGLSVISLSQTLTDQPDKKPNEKRIQVKSNELKNAKTIYFVAVVKRMAVKEERRGATRRANHGPSFSSSSQPKELMKLTRVGCIKVYEKDEDHSLDSGLQRMILVDRNEKPEFEVMFSQMETGAPMEWLKQIHNLEVVHRENANQQFQDQHLPLLTFTSVSPDFDETLEKLSTSRMKSPRTPRRDSFKSPTREQKRMRSPRTSTRWFSSRFPCYSFSDDNNGKPKLVPDEEYFKDSTVTVIENICLYRRTLERSFQCGISNVGGDNQDSSFSSRNISRLSGSGHYGLDCAVSKGHMPFLRTVYKTRNSSLVPSFDDKPRSMDSYPVSSAKAFTDYELYGKKRVPISKEHYREGSEMAVVEVPPTKEQIKSFNKRLQSASGNRESKRIRRQSVHDPNLKKPGTDFEGRAVPTFSEIVFPHGKTEIYNILCRYFYAEVGHRPGSTSPEYKSRLLTGFINKNYEHVFTHKLEAIFEKQLHLIGTTTPGWKAEHHQRPLDRIRELKREWKQSQQSHS